MNTRDIIAVRKVCELGNLSKAAGQLYLTPQALSLIVKKIENELGVTLFNRATGGMIMTKFGKKFFEKSNKLIQELKELEEMFRLDISNEKGSIKLAVALGVIAVIMPETIWKFSELYPNFRINVIEGTDYKVEELVRNETADIGIAKEPVNTDEFYVMPWCSFEQCALVNVESNFYKRTGEKEQISIIDLKDEALILENKDFKVHKKLQTLCKNWGFIPNIYFETTEISLAFSLAEANKGIALTPKNIIDLSKYQDLRLLTFQEDFNTEWCFIKKKNQELNEIENRFVDYLIKVTGLYGKM